MADLARELDLPLLVVARGRLGTVNHTRLTLEAAEARGLEVFGVVISHSTAEETEGDRRNLDGLRERLGQRLVLELAIVHRTRSVPGMSCRRQRGDRRARRPPGAPGPRLIAPCDEPLAAVARRPSVAFRTSTSKARTGDEMADERIERMGGA